MLADTNSYEQWNDGGRLDMEQRASRAWKQMLADYEQPAIDPGIDDALKDFIARKKSSMADEWH